MKNSENRNIIKVFKSRKHIYAYLVTDQGNVLCSMSSLQLKVKLNVENSKLIGEKFSEVLKEKKIKNVVFDRCGFKYHGRVKSLADGVRSGGFKF